MKTLQESLFDKDLVSKDTGKEYLYGYINRARVISYSALPFLDKSKIKHDFNKVIKKFPQQDWSDNQYESNAKIKFMMFDEILRQLLYIIVSQIPFSHINNEKKIADDVIKILKNYIVNDSEIDIVGMLNGIDYSGIRNKLDDWIRLSFIDTQDAMSIGIEFINGYKKNSAIGKIVITLDKE